MIVEGFVICRKKVKGKIANANFRTAGGAFVKKAGCQVLHK